MADVTYYVAMPFLQDDSGSPVAGAAEECQSSTMALRRAEILSRTPGYARAESTYLKEVEGFRTEVQKLQTSLDSAVLRDTRSSISSVSRRDGGGEAGSSR